MANYADQLASWKKAYPYLGANPTSTHRPTLGDYEDAKRKFYRMWGQSNPSPLSGATNPQYAFSPSAAEQGWQPTEADYALNQEYADWERQQAEAFGKMLTPEQSAEYHALKHDSYKSHQHLGQMAFLGAVGAMAAPGILGALGSGSGAGASTGAAFIPGADSAASGIGFASNVPSWALPGGSTAAELAGMGLGGQSEGSGNITVPGLDDYYTGHGGVDGSIKGSGVTNETGYGNWLSSLSPDLVKTFGTLLGGTDSLLKGLYGLYESKKFNDLGKGTPAQQTANSQLDTLLKNPNQIYSMPGWKAGLQAVERTGAGQGYLGSGNMMLALNDYGGKFYNDTVRQLNDIATGGQAVQAGYNVGAANLFGQGTNSIGYWLSKYGSPVFDMISGKP